jgi:Cu(I)/Ag(I) efflux system membrane fusion protein
MIAGAVLSIALSVAIVALFSAQKGLFKPPALKAEQPAGHVHGQQPPAQPQPAAEQPQAEEDVFEEEAPTVEIPPEKQQLIGVKKAVAEVRPIEKITRTVGRVAYDETRLATVNTKFEGWIEKLYVDYSGKYVKKGQPLADLYSPELVATQQEYLNVLRWAGQKEGEYGRMLSEDAKALVEAARQRLRYFDISDSQIEKIEKTGTPIRTLTVYAPASGYVVEKMALQGMKVMPGEKLFDIADLSTVWILADIYESELPMIKAGEKARISLSYFPGREFASGIDYVYPTLSGQTRTAKVRFSIQNPGLKLKPQMFTNVEIKTPLGKKLVIPESAIIDTGTRQIAYVDKGDGYFEPREIKAGLRAGGMAEVISGLSAGEVVASSAAFLIDSEAKLKGIVQ